MLEPIQPFRFLLNRYDQEAATLYQVVRSLFDYPSLSVGALAGIESKLFPIAFARIFSDFLHLTDEMYQNQDFPELLAIMDIRSSDFQFDTEDDFIEHLESEVLRYEGIVRSDLKSLFSTQMSLWGFMSAIFIMGGDDYKPDLNPDVFMYLTEF